MIDCPLYSTVLEASCVNNDTSVDSGGDTCSDFYDDFPEECGDYDNATFSAAVQCCACGGGLGMGKWFLFSSESVL